MLKGIGKGIDLEALENTARARLPESTYRRIAGGSQDELTLARNREAWSRIILAPHVLKGTPVASTETSVLGATVATPVLIAPAGLAAYALHPEAEKAVAHGAAAAGTLMALSTYAALTLEEVAAAAPGGLRWFQLYLQQDRGWSGELLERARAAGYRAIVFTVDAGDGMPGALGALPSLPPMMRSEFEPALRLSDIAWIKERCGLPVVVKGVLRPDDAADCVAAGADAIIVSNHGGRMMDTVAATAEALPRIVDAVGGKAEIFEPTAPEIEAMQAVIEENKQQGKDTHLKDL